jgi:hypothetical protein
LFIKQINFIAKRRKEMKYFKNVRVLTIFVMIFAVGFIVSGCATSSQISLLEEKVQQALDTSQKALEEAEDAKAASSECVQASEVSAKKAEEAAARAEGSAREAEASAVRAEKAAQKCQDIYERIVSK